VKLFSTELSHINEKSRSASKENTQGNSNTILLTKSQEERDRSILRGSTIKKRNMSQIIQSERNQIQGENIKKKKLNNLIHSPNILILDKSNQNAYSFCDKLPKVNIREMSVDVLPHKENINTKIKISDIIQLSRLAKPPFK
jgi:hypothetical protein